MPPAEDTVREPRAELVWLDGPRLRSLRLRAGLTQVALAAAAGAGGQALVAKLELGCRRASPELRARLGEVLGEEVPLAAPRGPSAAERRLQAKAAGHARVARAPSPGAVSAPARAAALAEWEVRAAAQLGPNPPRERVLEVAAQLRAAHMAGLARRSAAVRRKAANGRQVAEPNQEA